jgi:DNA (cytosine-5)-methyltransferase 1
MSLDTANHHHLQSTAVPRRSPSRAPASGSGAGPVKPLGIVDLFAGIGCVADGFSSTGAFETIALVDIDLDARDTYLHNRPDAEYLIRDVAKLSSQEIADAADGRSVAGVVGCPPCQGFSAAGKRRDDDERNKLLGAYFKTIASLKPMFFVMENVPSVLHRRELDVALEEIVPDYAVTRGMANAACFGLPQTRQRALVIGYRRDLEITPTLPAATHFGSRPVFHYGLGRAARPRRDRLDDLLGQAPQIGVPRGRRFRADELLGKHPQRLRALVTVQDAIGDLTGESTLPSAYVEELGSLAEPVNHEPWGHTEAMVRRMGAVREGAALPRGRYFSQAYARLHRLGLARTITTNFHNAGCGRFTHPHEPRTLTVREAARIQGIDNNFEFIGYKAHQERFVGNAFPPPLAAAVARHVRGQLAAAL